MIYYDNSYLHIYSMLNCAMSLSSFLGNSCFRLVATFIVVANKLVCSVLVLDTKLLLCNNLLRYEVCTTVTLIHAIQFNQ